MRKSLFCLSTIAAFSLPALPTLAAGDAPDRVELRSQRMAPVASTLAAACPSLHAQLPDALARTHRLVGDVATVQVSFTLQGQRISDVATLEGTARYQRAVRWALQELECAGDAAAPLRYTLKVRFVDPQQAAPGQALALVEDISAARLR